MKIKYLGTAAAEGYPAIFCSCDNCKKAFELGGRNIRSRAQAIIDDNLLIDFPCDTYYHCLINRIDLSKVRNCLITHIHKDHFYPLEFLYLQNAYSHPEPDYMLNIYGSEDTEEIIKTLPQAVGKFMQFTRINPFEPFCIDKYTVTALKAYHGTKNPYIYAVSDGEKTILYAHDTDIFPEETWQYMKQSGLRFDFVSLDCTEGAYEDLNYHGHMCLGRNILCRDRMLKEGLIDYKTITVLSHFSHNGLNSNYSDFVSLAAKEKMEVAFDGMEITF